MRVLGKMYGPEFLYGLLCAGGCKRESSCLMAWSDGEDLRCISLSLAHWPTSSVTARRSPSS